MKRLVITTAISSLLLAGPALAQHHHGHHAAHEATPPPGQATEGTDRADPHAGHGTSADVTDHSRMDHSTMDHTTMDHSTMDHGAMDHAGMDHSTMDHGSMDHSSMDHTSHHTQQTPLPREPIPPLTDADRAAAFPPIDHASMQHASSINSMLLFNRLEHWDGGHGQGQAWEASGWIGGDIHRLWLRSEGEREGGRTDSADVEVLYGRSVSPWWDVVAGVRQETRPDARTWAAVGIQGLAPYKFETAATLYVGNGSQALLNAEVEYEVLLTNRLVLQPLVEVELASRTEAAHGIGKGLSSIEAGLRLRYEITRRFAPYIGVAHERQFGETADLTGAQGVRARDTRWVAGVRVWF